MPVYPFDFTDPRLLSAVPFTIAIHRVERHFPPHRHDFLEVSLVIEGSGQEIINGMVHPMEPGSLTLVLPFHVHELLAHPGTPLRLFNCMFAPELLADRGEQLEILKEKLLDGDEGRSSFLQLSESNYQRISAIFQELQDEYYNEKELSHAMLRTKLAELMIRVERLRGKLPKTTSEARRGTPQRIYKALRHMHSRYQEPLSLASLAETFHFNRTYLSEQIKRHTGKNFLELLHEIRLRQACSLLMSSDMTISSIAYEVGYGSANTMFRAFLRYKGMTPTAYRNRRERSKGIDL